MSNSAYDCFLDAELERYYEEEETDLCFDDDEPAIEPNNDNYDGWDDMQ